MGCRCPSIESLFGELTTEGRPSLAPSVSFLSWLSLFFLPSLHFHARYDVLSVSSVFLSRLKTRYVCFSLFASFVSPHPEKETKKPANRNKGRKKETERGRCASRRVDFRGGVCTEHSLYPCSCVFLAVHARLRLLSPSFRVGPCSLQTSFLSFFL